MKVKIIKIIKNWLLIIKKRIGQHLDVVIVNQNNILIALKQINEAEN